MVAAYSGWRPSKGKVAHLCSVAAKTACKGGMIVQKGGT